MKLVEASDSRPESQSYSRREHQRRATRERLFIAAVEEFRRVGSSAAQIDRIAAAAGVSRGTFYFHFATREHVLIELQQRLEASIVQRIAKQRPAPASLAGWVRLVMESILAEQDALDDPRLVSEIMAMYIRQPIELDPARERSLPGAMNGLFEAAAERGEVRTDMTSEDLSRLFLVQIYGCMTHSHDPGDERRAAFEQMVDVFLRGISP